MFILAWNLQLTTECEKLKNLQHLSFAVFVANKFKKVRSRLSIPCTCIMILAGQKNGVWATETSSSYYWTDWDLWSSKVRVFFRIFCWWDYPFAHLGCAGWCSQSNRWGEAAGQGHCESEGHVSISEEHEDPWLRHGGGEQEHHLQLLEGRWFRCSLDADWGLQHFVWHHAVHCSQAAGCTLSNHFGVHA